MSAAGEFDSEEGSAAWFPQGDDSSEEEVPVKALLSENSRLGMVDSEETQAASRPKPVAPGAGDDVPGKFGVGITV